MTHSRFAAMGVGLLAIAAIAMADDKEAPRTAGAAPLATTKQKASYGIGLSIGQQVQAIDPDVESLVQGLRDSLSGSKPQLGQQEISQAVEAFKQDLQARRAEQGKAMAKKGEDFLAENKKKAGVVTTRSGLQYKVLKEGTGKAVRATDTATVNYEGRLVDGTVFDASAKHGGPAPFEVSGVVPGFSEALQLMKVGSKWQLYIPPNLAYGAQALPGIPPNSTLIFDLEVLDAKPSSAPAQPGIP